MNLKGWVYDEQGTPIVGAVVEAIDYETLTVLGATSSGTDGSWVLTGLPDRPVRVRIASGNLVRYLEGGARIVVDEATVRTLWVLAAANLATNSLSGAALQDGSVSTTKLAPLVPLLEGIEVPPHLLLFQRNDRLQVLGKYGIQVQLDPVAKKLELSLDSVLFWTPLAWLLPLPPGAYPAPSSGSNFG